MNDAFDTPDAPLAATGPLALLVMAGGSSSRLFPYNKVVADLTGCGRTMIQQAVDRGIAEGLEPPLVPADRFWIVTGDALAPDIGAQLPELPATNILIEPERRNTLPAILWAMAHVSAKHPDATLAVLTADHVIGDQDGFRATLRNAVAAAQRERVIVTIGIPPSDDAREWTGFGAVRVAQRDRASTDASGIRGVERFEEKPSIERARALMREGGTFWNSGMFVLRCTTLVDALRRYQPEIAAAYEELRTAVESGDADAAAAAFASLPKDCVDVTEPTRRVDNTIDYAVMVPLTHDERAEIGARLVPARFSWVDVGSWDALRKVVAADVRDNVIVGDAAIPGSRRTIAVAAEGQRVEASALERTIVVAAESCSIVVAESRAQDVKRLFAEAASSTDPTIAIDAPDCEIVCVEGRVAILGVEGLSVERRDGRTTVRPIRLARLAKLRERLLAGETVLESDYAASNGLDPDRSRDEIDWLVSLGREIDGAGFHGVEVAPNEGLVEATDRRLRAVAFDDTMLGAYDIRGEVARCFTDKVAFTIGLASAAFLLRHRVDGSFNVTASHNPASDDGVKWGIRARRGARSVALVGRSIRNTSPRIQQMLMDGLAAGGVDVRDLGACATPETYHALACFDETNDAAIAFDESTPLGDNRFVRSLDGNDAREIYAMLPRVSEFASGDTTAILAKLTRLQAAVADEPGVQRHVDRSYPRLHNAWVAARVRLGPDVSDALFEHWVQKRDAFGTLIERLADLEWPSTPDESFWADFRDRFELDDERFASSPASAVAHPFAGRSIGTDFANGSNWRKADVLANLGFEVIPVVAEGRDGEMVDSSVPDGAFPLHHPDPTKPEYQRHAIALATERDIPVVMFDEDGDRFTIVDERGRVVHGSDLAVLLAPGCRGPILADVRYSRSAMRALEATGRTIDRTLLRGPVGYAFYVEAALEIRKALASGDGATLFTSAGRSIELPADLVEEPVAFGIEPSGHAFFRSNGYANDASYMMGAALHLLFEIYASGETLADRSDSVPRDPASPPELRVRMTPDISVEERRRFVAAVVERLEADAERLGLDLAIDRMDGALLELRDADGNPVSQALVRNSNNESVFGLAFEGRTHAEKHRIEDFVIGALARTTIEASAGTVRADLESSRTSEYLKHPTPENREGDVDHPAVLERLGLLTPQ